MKVLAGFAITMAIASAPFQSGRDIMSALKEQSSFKDIKAELVLVLKNSAGQRKKRVMRFFAKKNEGGLLMMLMETVSPAMVKGIKFLSIEREGADDLRYLYIPAMRMVRRVEGSGKGGSFMSSDFTYYDIGETEIEDWNYELIGEKIVDGYGCYVIDAKPASERVEKETGYGRIRYYVRKKPLVLYRADYFNSEGVLFKKYRLQEFKEFEGGEIFATDFVMENILEKHSSHMVFRNLVTNSGLNDSIFSVRSLRRR